MYKRQVYGNDRVFAYIKFAGTSDSSQDAAVAALEAAGHPVVYVEISDLYELFGQIFSWEIATAVAGSVMGINPFNQPDVESAKIETRTLTSEYEKTGTLPVREPVLVDNGVKLYATPTYAATLKAAAVSYTHLKGVNGRNSDNTLIRNYLNWEPSIRLRDGMEKTMAWIEQQMLAGVASK